MKFFWFFPKFYKKAAEKMCLECQDFIERGEKILDLGCGAGIVGKNLRDFFESEVIGVDIQDTRIYPIPFQLIDGKHLPFPENFFDIVLISYVLHHAEDSTALLREAKRVSKNKLIIYEDLPEGIVSNLICRIHGFSFNKISQASFRSEKEWESVFKEVGLKVFFKKRVSAVFPFSYLVKRIQFVLSKKSSMDS